MAGMPVSRHTLSFRRAWQRVSPAESEFGTLSPKGLTIIILKYFWVLQMRGYSLTREAHNVVIPYPAWI
jgi:hypothetical protein